MKSVKRVVCGIALTFFIATGCSQNPSKMEESSARKVADNLTYVKDDKTGLCFAVVASRQTGSLQQNGFTITWVPCEKSVEDKIIRR